MIFSAWGFFCLAMAVVMGFTAGAVAEEVDSDGDGIPDKDDKHPFVAEMLNISWKVGELRLGWNVDLAVMESDKETTEETKKRLKQSEFKFGGSGNVTSSGEAGLQMRMGIVPVPNLKFDNRFSVSGDIGYQNSDQRQVQECSDILRSISRSKAFSKPFLEFTITFFNNSKSDFECENLEVPIQIDGEVVASAIHHSVGVDKINFTLPALRRGGTKISFRAELDTTRALQLVDFMKVKSPTFVLELSKGKITATIDGTKIDAISGLQEIQAATFPVKVQVGGQVFQWRVAQKNLTKGKALTMLEVMEAVNKATAATQEKSVFTIVNQEVTAIAGIEGMSKGPGGYWKIDTGEGLELMDQSMRERLGKAVDGGLYFQFVSTTRGEPYVNGLGMNFVPAGTKGVLFGVWETRVKDFRAFVSATGYDAIANTAKGMPAYTLEKEFGKGVTGKQAGGSWEDPRFPAGQHAQDENHPVVCVSYLDAEAFCEWLTKKERDGGRLPEGWRYRLPTDEEWSEACGPTEFPWGAKFPPGNGDGNYSGVEAMVGPLEGFTNDLVKAGRNDGWARTAPVGSYVANRYGLYDMGGNVWEWCSSWYVSTMNDAETLAAVPGLKEDGGGKTARVVRGGSWCNSGRVFLRSASRGYDVPRSRHDGYGFRVVLVGGGG